MDTRFVEVDYLQTFNIPMTKRPAFAWEQEVRAIARTGLHGIYSTPGVPNLDEVQIGPDDEGWYADVDLDVLIDRVHVAPDASAWHRDAVAAVLNAFGIDKEIRMSELDDIDSSA